MKKLIVLLAIAFTLCWCQAAPTNAVCLAPQTMDVFSGDTVPPFYVPNAFTPNNDGVNEHFMLKYELSPEETFSTFFMMIYDRFGHILFKSYNPVAYWDGKDKNGNICPTGVYTYVIKYKLRRTPKQESVGKNDLEVKTGNVVLIR